MQQQLPKNLSTEDAQFITQYWESWFSTFGERKLVFVYQEHLKDGRLSNFFKLDSPFREHE